MENYNRLFKEKKAWLRAGMLMTNIWFVTSISLVLISLGFLLEVSFGNLMLSRMGALITVLAIIALWVSVRFLSALEAVRVIREGLEKQFPGLKEDEPIETFAPRLQQVMPSNEQHILMAANIQSMMRITRKAKKEVSEQNNRLINAQIFWASIGTLIWAFGDILANLIVHCGRISCSS